MGPVFVLIAAVSAPPAVKPAPVASPAPAAATAPAPASATAPAPVPPPAPVIEIRSEGGLVHVRTVKAPVADVLDKYTSVVGTKFVFEGLGVPRRPVSLRIAGSDPVKAVSDMLAGMGLSFALKLDQKVKVPERVFITSVKARPSGPALVDDGIPRKKSGRPMKDEEIARRTDRRRDRAEGERKEGGEGKDPVAAVGGAGRSGGATPVAPAAVPAGPPAVVVVPEGGAGGQGKPFPYTPPEPGARGPGTFPAGPQPGPMPSAAPAAPKGTNPLLVVPSPAPGGSD